MGVILALGSSFIDVGTNFLVRGLGNSVPSAFIPFISGIFSTFCFFTYCLIFDPFNFGPSNDPNERWGLAAFYGLIGSICGWIALESLCTGLRISKSALASYAEQSGVLVPFTFDFLILHRPFLLTDGIGMSIIIIFQSYQAYISVQKSKKENDR